MQTTTPKDPSVTWLAPKITPITSIADMRGWKNFAEQTNVACVPLAKRAPLPDDAMPSVLGFDNGEFDYDPFFTLYSQGACGENEERSAANAYNFSYWQYADISYYFAHTLLNIPPVVWTNAAHKNGVFSLGSLNFNWGENERIFNGFTQEQIVDLLTKKPSNPDPSKLYLEDAIAILKDVRDFYGFDGYLINSENVFNNYSDTLRINFKILLSSLKEPTNGKQTENICMLYDCGTFNGENGVVSWLNPGQYDLFVDAGQWHSDYGWFPTTQVGPKMSWQTITQNESNPDKQMALRKKVYAGLDCAIERRQAPYGPNNWYFRKLKEIQDTKGSPPNYFSGSLMYYPAWTMYDFRVKGIIPSRDLFHNNDQAFWTGTKDILNYPGRGTVIVGPDDFMSRYLQPRTTIISTPFLTWFNDGEGDFYNIYGELKSTGPWNNLSDQHVLPTHRFTFNGGQTAKQNKTRIYRDSSKNVWCGGSSLYVEGFANLATVLDLFNANVPIKRGCCIKFVVKTEVAKQQIFPLITVSSDPQKSVPVALTGSQELVNGWTKLTFAIPGYYIGYSLLKVQLQFNQLREFYLGAFSIEDVGEDHQPANFTFEAGTWILDWERTYDASSHYRVFGIKNKGPMLIGVTYNWQYRVAYGSEQADHIFNKDVNGFDGGYVVQEVNKFGETRALSD